jgi:octaprenyl-diphosphate synthase
MDSLGNFSASGVPPFKLIDHQLRQVKILINQQLAAPAKAESIKPLLEHINTCSGKMVRPGLVLLAGACCGQIKNEHIKVAAIVEMIHNATLLHDDVIDDGQKRRGLPTVNSLWGNEAAVLLGDFLLSRALKLYTGLNQGIANLIAVTTARTCDGELRQVIQRKNWTLDESEYIDIITEKSAAFFSGCCQLGAVLSQADESKVD